MLTAFLREAALLKSLTHPNVVQSIGNAYEDGMLRWVVTEFANGGSLTAWLERKVGHVFRCRLSPRR